MSYPPPGGPTPPGNEPPSYNPPPGGGYGGPPPGYNPPPGGDPYGVPPQTSNKAIWALVTGLLGLLCCGVIGIAGIILGNQAKAEIEASQGRLTGTGMAKAGFILGIVSIVLTVLGVLLYVGLFATGAIDAESGTY
ncbi:MULTISPECIES: DUF4190 domain-containing protein [Mumia]|uniref:DUF4190 domain-containing protein n=1 Tax=Mumia TaxID=1546255 RepID=UPI0014216705|nr:MULTISPECIES: DUF4190 domain-containing protein [unclassified Mumia]QMW67797.1 DUF4190 domain-containing protein [Mumia sp. ZJ1417]